MTLTGKAVIVTKNDQKADEDEWGEPIEDEDTVIELFEDPTAPGGLRPIIRIEGEDDDEDQSAYKPDPMVMTYDELKAESIKDYGQEWFDKYGDASIKAALWLIGETGSGEEDE